LIHHVFANRSNIGDWLSARAIQALLGPIPLTEHLCDEPFVSQTLAALRKAKVGDVIIIGGGGLFMDYFVPFWEGFSAIAERIPFCIWGVGCCDMKRENSRPPQMLLVDIIRRSRLCAVRDQLTRRQFPECEIPSATACPTMSLLEPLPPGFGLLHVDAFDNVGEENYETMESVGKTYAAETNRAFRSINNLIPAGRENALHSALAEYAQADLVLAGRLHGCIIGLAMGRKVLAVSGDNKVESFMDAAGLGEWVLDLNELERLPRRLRALPAQTAPVAFLQRARSEAREVADRVRTIIAEAQA
jgi:polysaccharide pyruvyl transferase WcaK-like protein